MNFIWRVKIGKEQGPASVSKLIAAPDLHTVLLEAADMIPAPRDNAKPSGWIHIGYVGEME